MGLLPLLFQDPLTFVLLVIPLLYSIIIHELAHGWVALRQGDPTAWYLGRLTLNPLRHLDPLGTAMLFLVGFGWAKPVPVNPRNIRNQRHGMMLVSSAGIIANISFAFLGLLAERIFALSTDSSLGVMLYFFVQINIMLAAFNLIPIPPLDGSKIIADLLPYSARYWFDRIEPYGFFLIIGLLFFGFLTPLVAVIRAVISALIMALLP
jgi:Zn-dependent protease